ncbi:MAG: hypothetical protein K8R06_07085, partial [Methanosarcinales archaeon]|nr:hypothetical protein [Methanosarcinales archaeon]
SLFIPLMLIACDIALFGTGWLIGHDLNYQTRLKEMLQNGFFVSTSKSRVKCIFGLSKSSALAGFRFQKGVSYP